MNYLQIYKNRGRKIALYLCTIFFSSFLFLLLNTTKVEAYGESFNANNRGLITTAYEVQNIYISNGSIHIQGVYYAIGYQNYSLSGNTHRYQLYIPQTGKIYNDLNDYNTGDTQTNIQNMAGYGYCSSISSQPPVNNQDYCNYYYNDVGFHFSVPLSDFNSSIPASTKDFHFKLRLTCMASQWGTYTFEQFAFVPSSIANINTSVNGYTAKLSSSMDTSTIIVNQTTALVRSGPSKSAAVPTSSGNRLYWAYSAQFPQNTYAGQNENIGWYQLRYAVSHWDNNRLRVVYSPSGSIGYINSSFFTLQSYNETSKALKLTITNNAPKISASTQSYYRGQTLTDNMIRSAIISHDAEDGLLNSYAKVTIESSGGLSKNANGTYNTNIAGNYTFKAAVTDSKGAKTTVNFTIRLFNNTPPVIYNLKDKYQFHIGQNITTSSLFSKYNVYANDAEDGKVSVQTSLNGSNINLNNTITGQLGIFEYTAKASDIPLINVANSKLYNQEPASWQYNGQRTTANAFSNSSSTVRSEIFSVSGGRNYQITVPTATFSIVEFDSSGKMIRSSGWINKSYNSYTMQASTNRISICMPKASNNAGYTAIRDAFAENVRLTTTKKYQIRIAEYKPPNITATDMYVFVGDVLSLEDVKKQVTITDEFYEASEVAKSLRVYDFEKVDTYQVGDYLVKLEVKNNGYLENPSLSPDKYTSSSYKTIHVIMKDSMDFYRGHIRYISTKYLDTLENNSNWKTDGVLNHKLTKALQKDTNTPLVSFSFTSNEIKDLQSHIKNTKDEELFTTSFNQAFYSKLKNYMEINNIGDSWKKVDTEWCYQDKDGNLYKDTWKEIDGHTYYFDSNGYLSYSKWVTIDGINYYFSSDGSLAQGWTLIINQYYYFDTPGIKATGFTEIDGNTYYFDETGIMLSGWQNIGEFEYYFDKDGKMVKDAILEINGKEYYFNKDGHHVVGFFVFEGNTYYGDSEDGLIRNQFYTINRETYYFNHDGHMAKGITNINSNIYCFHENGHLLIDQFFQFDGAVYYANDTGILLQGDGLVSIKSYTYYIQSNAIQSSIWKDIDGHTYYFDNTGKMVIDVIFTLNNNSYITDENGWLIKDKLINDMYYADENGILAKNKFITLNANTYYFREDCSLIKNEIFTVDTDSYFANENGILLTGMQMYNDNQYFFNDDYKMAKSTFITMLLKTYYAGNDGLFIKNNEVEINGNYYYFDDSGARYENILTNIPGKAEEEIFFFTKDGVRIEQGFFEDTSKVGTPEYGTYYLENHQILKNTIKTIDDNIYYFDEIGRLVIGKYQIENTEYYTTQTGERITTPGWYCIDSSWYYFDMNEDGNIIPSKPQNTTLSFSKDGAMISEGFVKIENQIYYMIPQIINVDYYKEIKEGKEYYYYQDSSTLIKHYRPYAISWGVPRFITGDIEIDNKKYTFNMEGHLISIDGLPIDEKNIPEVMK